MFQTIGAFLDELAFYAEIIGMLFFAKGGVFVLAWMAWITYRIVMLERR